MTASRWQRVQELLVAALERPPEARAGFLTRECAEADVRAEVVSLLAASEEAGEYFDGLADRAQLLSDDTLPDDPLPGEPVPGDLSGRRVGAYRLERLLGRGGMGTVYLAERADGQFAQRVAIKLLSTGAVSTDAHRRFLAEREILAGLQHPNIAGLFDGGVIEDGTPYFVMEYVEGTRIDEFCDRLGLDVDQRLELFLQVCDAVTFAHANRIVHRDIKPANVLVADEQVRLLDFGIAKLLDPQGDRFQTGSGLGPMTPAYASPEQLTGGEVTAATDVYALGVLLYELLAGLSPYEADASSSAAIARAVCEVPITPPSTRLRRMSTSAPGTRPALEGIASARRASGAALARSIRGDLDTILLTALQKEPERRYASVRALAEDVGQHRRGFPIRARRASWTHRLSRFVGRHRVAASIAGVAGLLTVALTAVSLRFARTSSAQADLIAEGQGRTRGLMQHLIELYEAADPYSTPGATAAARQMLDQAVARLQGGTSSDPEIRAALLFAAGRVYNRLGLADQAQPLLEEALEIRRRLHGAPHEELHETLLELGSSVGRSGDPVRGIGLLQEGLELALALHGEDSLPVARLRFELGTAHHDRGDHRESQTEFEESIRIYRAHPAEPSEGHANVLLVLGDFVAVTGRIEEAARMYEEALEIFLSVRGPDHPAVARTLNGLGLILYNLDRKEEAVTHLREALRVDRAAYGAAGHPDLASILENLGGVLAHEGEPEGVGLLREAVEMYRHQSATNATTLGGCLTGLGKALVIHGDPDEAAEAFESALSTYAAGGVDALFQVETRRRLGLLLSRDGPSERAVELLSDALAAYDGLLPDDHPRVVALRAELEEARK